MSIAFRALLMLVSLAAFAYVIRQIRRSRMQIEDTVFWVLFSLAILLLSLFPGVAIWASELLGIMSPANFVFLGFLFITIAQLFRLSVRLSRLDHKVRTLTQELALKEYELQKSKNKKASA